MPTRAERETLIRFDDESGEMTVYTASPAVKRRLERRGYVFTELSPASWQATAPKKAVTLRKLPMKAGTRTGRPFHGQNHRVDAPSGETTG